MSPLRLAPQPSLLSRIISIFRKLMRAPLCRFKRSLPRTLSQLELIPPEVLGLIIDFLDRADIVCLGLTSRGLLRTTGTSSWPKRKDRALRMVMLSRVARDLPGMFCCYYCAKLHPSKLVGPPPNARLGRGDECPEIGGWVSHRQPGPIPSPLLDAPGLGISYRFRVSHLALAMKRYYRGPAHGIPLHSLAYTEVMARDAMFTTLFSVEARICPSEQGPSTLVLHQQDWALMHDDDSGVEQFACIMRNWRICRHQYSDTLQERIASALDSRDFGRGQRPEAEVLECPQCGVEFQLDLRDCGGEGRAVVVTKWLDLGSGLTPDDPRLLALVSRDFRGLVADQAVASSGLTRHRYQAAAVHGLQGNDIGERNYRYLAEREYRRELRTSWLDPGVWTSSE